MELVVTPRDDDPDHQPQVVNVWINDEPVSQQLDAGGKPMHQKLEIPNNLLRAGANELTLQTYNKVKLGRGQTLAGGAEKTVTVFCDRPAVRQSVFGVAVGVDDYSASVDSKGKKGVLRGSESSRRGCRGDSTGDLQPKAFGRAEIKLLIQDANNKDVSRNKLREALADLAVPGAVHRRPGGFVSIRPWLLPHRIRRQGPQLLGVLLSGI